MQQTDLPRGAPEEMAGLKLKHITTRGELNRWEQENISEAMDWLDCAYSCSSIPVTVIKRKSRLLLKSNSS